MTLFTRFTFQLGLFVFTATNLPATAASAQIRTDPAEAIASAAIELQTPHGMDFSALERAIGDSRIVMLGEPWHGDGGAIALRGKLVRFLHERMNFDVLVFESDFYGLRLGWERALKDGKVGRMAAGNVYAFWSQTESAAPLWDYIEAKARSDDPLIVAGVDIKAIGETSRHALPGDLKQQLVQLMGTDQSDVERAISTLKARLSAPDDVNLEGEDQVHLLRLVEALERHLTSSEPGSFRTQMAKSLRRFLADENRDPAMADNLIWLATHQFPDQKLVVWAHNNHVLTNKWTFYESHDENVRAFFADEPMESIGQRTYLGEATRHFFGAAMYSIATLSHGGRYTLDIAPALRGQPASFEIAAMLDPAPRGSLEPALHEAGHKVAFVDLRPFQCREGAVVSRVLDYSQLIPLALPLWRGYDGLLYLDRTHALND